jgi:DNA-binding CsgD family transcriptional regulator
MNRETIAAEAEPLTDVAHPESPVRVSLHLAYEMAVVDWTRVTRSFVRSLQAYKNVNRARTGRLVRSAPTAMTEVVATIAEPPAAPPLSVTQTDPQTHPLTRRQFEIAELISCGLSNEEIANRLVLTPGTVGNHVGHILRRLSARNRAQVASWVTQVAAGHREDRDSPA